MAKNKESRSWTSEEWEIMTEMFMNGKTTGEIADVLCRTRGSVRRKLYDRYGTSSFAEFIKEEGKLSNASTMSDAEMVALLREHGWEVTCRKMQMIEL